MSFTPVIITHGGAGTHVLVLHDNVAQSQITDGVKAAARAGYALLQTGGSAIDAVEKAAKVLEDNPIFNAGHGSYLTTDGVVEMDASIMDGASLRAGGVACITNVLNPIEVARLVMDKSDHVLMVGEGAKRFAVEKGIKTVSPESLITEKAKRRLEQFRTFNPSVKLEFDESKPNPQKDGSHDTVGAVAVDSFGNVAYATTTGGINAKRPGRCGDSPIPGCAGYSDNLIGTVSTTGHGESFIKTNIARLVLFYIEQGTDVQKAVQKALEYTVKRVGGCGGLIALTPKGDIGVAFNTEGMSWASIKEGQIQYGIYEGEKMTEPF